MISKALHELKEWSQAAFGSLPGGIGRRLRAAGLRRGVAQLGPRARIDVGVRFSGCERVSIGSDFAVLRLSALQAHDGGRIVIGDRVSLNTNVLVSAAEGGDISIADDVLIGPNVVLRASDHVFASRERPINTQGHKPGRISVGRGAWLGANCVLVAGASVGEHAVVAAGAVVTGKIPAYAVAGGVPAKVLKERPA